MGLFGLSIDIATYLIHAERLEDFSFIQNKSMDFFIGVGAQPFWTQCLDWQATRHCYIATKLFYYMSKS